LLVVKRDQRMLPVLVPEREISGMREDPSALVERWDVPLAWHIPVRLQSRAHRCAAAEERAG
jgi:hypothetical protein